MDMRGDLRGGGVCLVRAEPQGDGFLITVITTSGAARGQQETVRNFVDPEEALAAVSAFMHSVTDAIDGPKRRPPGELG
jgi:hypothetical protein